MRSEDFNAIRSFDNKQNKFLSVETGKDGKEYLDIKERNFLGRILMVLGISSSSLNKVAKYINQNITVNDINTGNKEAFNKIDEKIFHYQEKRGYRCENSILEAADIIMTIVLHEGYANDKVLQYEEKLEKLNSNIESIKFQLHHLKDLKIEPKLEEQIKKLEGEKVNINKKLNLARGASTMNRIAQNTFSKSEKKGSFDNPYELG